MCAHTARGSGDYARASGIMNEARSFARQSYDDMSGIVIQQYFVYAMYHNLIMLIPLSSVESVAGFILLCLYWIGNDANVMKHYGSIACTHFPLFLLAYCCSNVTLLLILC
jgi:hypothetical protein